MKLFSSLEKNLEKIEKIMRSDDLSVLRLEIGSTAAALIFAKDIVDKEAIGELILRPAAGFSGEFTEKDSVKVFLSPEKKTVETFEDLTSSVVTGEAVLVADGIKKGFAFGLRKFEQRAIAEPPTSTVLKGPREGFVESLPVNVSMMRRKLKSEKLVFENLTAGKLSNTPICLCYIDGVADEKLVEALKNRINQINIDAVLDSSYVSKFLGEHKTSVFKQIGNTEKPDVLAAKILEGRVAVFVDGSPIALTAPYLLIEDFQSPSDYYGSPYSATLARLLRLLSVTLSLMLPAFFVAAELFHLQFIPLSFLLTIVNSIKGIPLSPSYEMFFTLLIFEILNEASVRMPRYVGMVVSIVGGLVLGETAVNAGIISAPTLMIVALSGICLYTVPELEQTFSVIRLVFLIAAGSFGAYGLIAAVCILMIYLISFENYGTPLCAPYAPLIRADVKDGFIKGFLSDQTKRPASLKPTNVRRQGK